MAERDGAPSAQIGVIGLGEMGARMAARLLAAGHALAVHDIRPDAVGELAELGARPCDSPAEVARLAATVLLSLPSPETVLAVAMELGGAEAAVRTCIDLSTTGLATERRLAAKLGEAGIALIDAPVSGGVSAAERGELTLMAACAEDELEGARPLLDRLAARIFHVGAEPGMGQLAKVINNLLSATALVATAEAVALGVKGGLDAGRLIEVLNASSGRNSATLEKFPRAVLDRSFQSGFALALMNKDVQLCLSEAAQSGVPMAIGTSVGELWAGAAASARAGADCTEVVKLVEAAATIRIGTDGAGS